MGLGRESWLGGGGGKQADMCALGKAVWRVEGGKSGRLSPVRAQGVAGALLTGSNVQGFTCAPLLRGWTVLTLQSPVCSSFLWPYCVQKEVRWKMGEGQEGTMEMEKGLRVVNTPAPPLCAW